MNQYIPRQDLITGGLYRIEGRTAWLGVWDANIGRFHVANYSCGGFTLDTELHWDDDPKYGTAQPLLLLETGVELNDETLLGFLRGKMNQYER